MNDTSVTEKEFTPNDREWYLEVIKNRRHYIDNTQKTIAWHKEMLAGQQARLKKDKQSLAEAERWLEEFDAQRDVMDVKFGVQS